MTSRNTATILIVTILQVMCINPADAQSDMLEYYANQLSQDRSEKISDDLFYRLNFGLLIEHLNAQIEEAQKANDSIRIFETWEKLAHLSELNEMPLQAGQWYETLIGSPIIRRDNSKMGIYSNQLARLYAQRARYDLALRTLNKSLGHAEKEGDSVVLSDIRLNLARVYHQLKDTTLTIQWLDRSRELKQIYDQNEGMERLLAFEVRAYADFGDLQRALASFESLRSRCLLRCSSSSRHLIPFISGVISFAQGNLDDSEKYFTHSLHEAKVNHRSFLSAESAIKLAIIEVKRRTYKKALAYLSEAEQICLDRDFNELLLAIYEQYVNVYTALNDLNNLAHYQGLYIEQRDKIYSEELLVEISSTQAELETRDDVRMVEEQKELMHLQEETLAQKVRINFAIGGVVVLLLIILLILYHINQRKKAFNRKLDKMVHTRTRELEQKQAELQKYSYELSLEIRGLQKQMRSQLLTLEGLYNLAEREPSGASRDARLEELGTAINELRREIEELKQFSQNGYAEIRY